MRKPGTHNFANNTVTTTTTDPFGHSTTVTTGFTGTQASR